MKIVIACGGTGGHLFPGLAVAETLLAREHKVKLLVSQRVLEKDVLDALRFCVDGHRLGVRSISAVGLNGSRRAIPFAWGLARAMGECVSLYHQFQPQAVLGMGGYTAAPAICAARLFRSQRTATFIHESNAIPGRANRFVRRMTDRVFVGLSDCGQYFPGQSVTVTGTPLRRVLRDGRRVSDAHDRLGLDPHRATVLVMGGSQGASPINEALAATLPWLRELKTPLQFLHLCGENDEAFVRESYRVNGMTGHVISFCREMELAYSVADMAIARAGAATLAELAAYGLPSVLIPLPHAKGNHQWHNARVFETAGAARLYDQRQLEQGTHASCGEKLAGAMIKILTKPDVRHAMSTAARALAKHDAAEEIATLVEEMGREKHERLNRGRASRLWRRSGAQHRGLATMPHGLWHAHESGSRTHPTSSGGEVA